MTDNKEDEQDYEELRVTTETEEVDKEIVTMSGNNGMFKKIAVVNEPQLELQALQPGEHIDVELAFDDGLEAFYDEENNTQFYNVKVEYKGEDVQFKFPEKWHDALFDGRGRGDKVRIKRTNWVNSYSVPDGADLEDYEGMSTDELVDEDGVMFFQRYEFETLD